MDTRKDVTVILDESIISPEKNEDSAFFAAFINEIKPLIIEKDVTYEFSLGSIRFDKHLYLDENLAGHYYVDTKTVRGRGSFSEVRDLGSVTISADNTVIFTPKTDKVARIQGTSSLRKSGSTHRHRTSMGEHEIGKNFAHLSMQEPIKLVTTPKSLPLNSSGVGRGTSPSPQRGERRDSNEPRELRRSRSVSSPRRRQESPRLKESERLEQTPIKKSVTIMKKLPGENFDDATMNLLNGGVTTKEMLDWCIIPLLETYQQQIESAKRAHRDLKPGNILVDIPNPMGSNPCVINFIDVDLSLPLGCEDNPKGTIGYLPLEAFNEGTLVQSSRDIFALGVLIISAFCPSLLPENYLVNLYRKGNPDLSQPIDPVILRNITLELLEGLESYDAMQLLEKGEILMFEGISFNQQGIFVFMSDEEPLPYDLYNELHTALNQMTAKDPAIRQNITHWITIFKDISHRMGLQQTPAPTAAIPVLPIGMAHRLFGNTGTSPLSSADHKANTPPPFESKSEAEQINKPKSPR